MQRLETRGVLLADTDLGALGHVVTRALRPLSWVPIPQLPPGYPVRPHEVLRLAACRAGTWSGLVPSDLGMLFKLALSLSRNLPARTLLALRRDVDGASAFKAYREGRPAFKRGADPDHELPYPVLDGNPEDLRALLAATGVRERDVVDRLILSLENREPDFLPELLERLGVTLVLPALSDLLKAPDARVLTFVDERSPLHRNSP